MIANITNICDIIQNKKLYRESEYCIAFVS